MKILIGLMAKSYAMQFTLKNSTRNVSAFIILLFVSTVLQMPSNKTQIRSQVWVIYLYSNLAILSDLLFPCALIPIDTYYNKVLLTL